METKRISSVYRETADGSIYRKIATFTTSSLLSLVNLAMILFGFIVGRVFRRNSREKSRLSEPENLNQELPAMENGQDFMDENVERRMPAFSFKYQTLNLEEKPIMTDEEEEMGETENSEEMDTAFMVAIHNHPFPYDKDVSRLMEELQNIAFHVRQLLARFDRKKIDGEDADMGFLYAEDFLKPLLKSVLEEEDGNSSESDADVQSRLNDEEYIEEAKIGEKLPSPVQIEADIEENFDETTSAEKERTGNPEFGLRLLIEYVEDSSGGARVDSFGEVHFVKDFDMEEVGNGAEEVGNGADDLANSSNAFPEKKADPYDDAPKGLEDVRKKTEKSEAPDFDEELDEQWEQEELIEQLKMELKKARAAGLPTIPEEFDSHRGIEALKPFRINLNFLGEDPLDNLQNIYRSYRERMRELDILDYEKMYEMGYMQMKNSTHSFGIQGKFFSTMPRFSQNLFFCHKKFENAPSKKLIDDLQRELETVYVGEICLSWEFLIWQYEKLHELLESDPRRSRQYNQLAYEFQEFQFLIQRFTKNEQFHGPRLQNYGQQRCVFANFLQVPFMKEDCLKENMENRESENSITGEMLEDIMEEAIKIFWEFVKAEKHKTPMLLKILNKNNAELQDPSDYRLMEEIQSDLKKKEKKLKDLQRSGNCILKKFKKPQEDKTNQDLFFSQIDLKLVSRVLKMSRISSDQLCWCHRKLSNYNFSPGKVHRVPSFLLFPH